MAKEKYDLVDGCTSSNFSTDDGCTRWWRWLHQFRRVIFFLYTADPMQTNMHIDCMIVIECDACKIFGAYALLDYITTRIGGNAGNKHSMQVTHIKKLRIFQLFHPNLNYFLNNLTPRSAVECQILLILKNGNQGRAVWQILGYSFHNARKPPAVQIIAPITTPSIKLPR